jgi:hypothetical protein
MADALATWAAIAGDLGAWLAFVIPIVAGIGIVRVIVDSIKSAANGV